MAMKREHTANPRRIGYLMTYACQMLLAMTYLIPMINIYRSYFSRLSSTSHLTHWYDLITENMTSACVVALLVATPTTMLVHFLCADKSERKHLLLGTITTVILLLMFVAPRIAQIASETTRHHVAEELTDTYVLAKLYVRTIFAVLIGSDVYGIDRDKDRGWRRITKRLKCFALTSLIASVALTVLVCAIQPDYRYAEPVIVILVILLTLPTNEFRGFLLRRTIARQRQSRCPRQRALHKRSPRFP